MAVPQSTYKKSPETAEREVAEVLWEGGEFAGLIVLSDTGKLYTTQGDLWLDKPNIVYEYL